MHRNYMGTRKGRKIYGTPPEIERYVKIRKDKQFQKGKGRDPYRFPEAQRWHPVPYYR